MSTKETEFRSKDHKQYWGILTQKSLHKPFHKPDNFISLLQEQYQTERLPGKDQPELVTMINK
jgi:hypothetical protein